MILEEQSSPIIANYCIFFYCLEMTDSGILSFKTPEEMHEYMKNIGLGFEYSCIRENNPVSE